MTRALIVYATAEGQTERIAKRIAEAMAREGHSAELLDAESTTKPPDLGRFQLIVVGAPIHAGGYPRAISRFVRANQAALSRVPSAFFSVGLGILSRSPEGRQHTLELVDKFLEQTGWKPSRIELIAGALPYTQYNFLVRFVMKRIVAHEGGDTDTSRDYEYTDWAAVDRFAHELLESVWATPAKPPTSAVVHACPVCRSSSASTMSARQSERVALLARARGYRRTDKSSPPRRRSTYSD